MSNGLPKQNTKFPTPHYMPSQIYGCELRWIDEDRSGVTRQKNMNDAPLRFAWAGDGKLGTRHLFNPYYHWFCSPDCTRPDCESCGVYCACRGCEPNWWRFYPLTGYKSKVKQDTDPFYDEFLNLNVLEEIERKARESRF